jgi:hypothetical protein
MLTYAYYPFKEDIEELEAIDLSVLKTIAEGWYIDYKSQPIKTVDFAKHLAAFANQYGGFLFIGINEAVDGSKCAGFFTGVADADLQNLSIQIREASSAHVNPPVLYEEKIIKGPCDELGLLENRSVVIIGIPKSVNTPHIHSSGRIYRRLADHSDPKPETDRHILDELWKRGEAHRLKVSKFLSETPPLPKFDSNFAWAYIYFRPDENQPPPVARISFDKFAEITTNSNNNIKGLHAPMDAIFSAQGGFIARQTKLNDPSNPTLTFRWWHDGTARLEVPLNKYDLITFKEINHFKHSENFCLLLKDLNFESATIVDYSMLLLAISGLSNIYIELLKILNDKRDTYSCFILKNISFTSPYLNTEKYLLRIKSHSLPLVAENYIAGPDEPHQGNMFCHEFDSRFKYDEFAHGTVPIAFSLPLISNILRCIGAIQEGEDLLEDPEIIRIVVAGKEFNWVSPR